MRTWRMFVEGVARTLPVLMVGAAPAALAGPAEPGQEPFEVTQEAVDRILMEVVPAVEQELGMELEVRSRLATREEIAFVLAEENFPMVSAQLGDAEEGEARSYELGWSLSENLLAKYAYEADEILVNAGVFEDAALTYEIDEVLSEPFLRAVLVHEVVHDADEQRYAFSEVLQQRATGPGVAAYSAVFEGHAQFVARAVCEEHGWLEAFERFTGLIGYLPEEQLEDLDPLTAITARVQASDARTSYHAGERFIAAIRAAGGAEAVERAFKDPPATLESVLTPEWFLNPASRPVSEFDLTAGLERFRVLNQHEGWQQMRGTLMKPQIAAGLTGLPQPLIDRVLESIRTAHSQVLTRGGGDKLVMAVLYEVTSPSSGQDFLEVAQKFSEYKDGNLDSGPIKLLSAEYTEVEHEGLRGFMAHKRIEYMGEEVEVRSGVLQSGMLICEMTCSNLPWGEEQMLLDARQVLASARGLDLPWGVESFEPAGLPAGWEVAETASPDPTATGTTATWTTSADAEAPQGEQVLRVEAANTGHTFNLLLEGARRTADLSVRVQLRADGGEEDQGGGVCWRVQDADNYYVTRWNPLEDNLRVYKVEAGVRHELQSAEVKADPAAWHELEASMEGSHISVRFDGEELLSIDDETFSAAAGGRVGLWTKADASVSFDAFSVR